MITIGVDAHKRLHVALALDEAGREIGQWQGKNSAAGWRDLAQWAGAIGADRQWGIEGAWGYGRGLAQHLVALEETVYEINPRWTAQDRRRARKTGKTDRLDARAVALMVRQEASTLPQVAPEDQTAVLDLLTRERDAAVGEATRLRNQIHALLVYLDPDYESRLPTLKSRAGLAALETYASFSHDSLSQARAASVRRLAQRLRLALSRARASARRCVLSSATSPEQFGACGRNVIRSDLHVRRPSSPDPLHIRALLSLLRGA